MYENVRNIERKRGISLIALIVTVGVMIVLASVIVVSVKESIDDASIVAFAEDLSKLEDSVEAYNLINDSFPTADPNEVALNQGDVTNLVPSDVRGAFTQELQLNGDLELDSSLGAYYKIDLSKLDVESSIRGMKKSGDADIYVVSVKTMTVYYLKGETIRGETYFSLSSKISNYAQNVVTNNGNLSGEGTIAQTVGSITVTKLKKTWTNKMGITVSTYMDEGETLHVKSSASTTEMQITTNSGQNNVISFNNFTDINNTYSTQDEAFKNKKGAEKYIEIYKKKSGTTVDTVKVDLSNYEATSPNIDTMEYSQSGSGEGNTVTLKVSDEESGIKEIRYDYLQKYNENGNLVDYYKGVTGETSKLDAEYLKARGHKAQIASDGTVKLTIPFNVQRIQVLAVDNAGNWKSQEQSITTTTAYINLDLISIKQNGLTFKVVSRDIKENLSTGTYTLEISTDGVNYTNKLNKTITYENHLYTETITDYERGNNITDYVWIKLTNDAQKESMIFKFNISDSFYISDGKQTSDFRYGSAKEVAANPNIYYGADVTNYVSPNGKNMKWEIFYSDGANIYLIADDYYLIQETGTHFNLPATANGHKPKILNDGSHWLASLDFTPILEDYEGSESITDVRLRNLNSKYYEYLNKNNKTSTNDNMKAVAYIMDTSIWNIYAGDDAEYAIGSPTVELFLNSWNEKHPDKRVDYQVADGEFLTGSLTTTVSGLNGYSYKEIDKNNWATFTDSIFNKYDIGLYTLQYLEWGKADGMWLASPCGGADNDTDENLIIGVSDSSSGGGQIVPTNVKTPYKKFGLRPIVCLKSSVELARVAENSYVIVH